MSFDAALPAEVIGRGGHLAHVTSDGMAPRSTEPGPARDDARAPSASPVRFHFDFISPYAYIAWTQIHRLAERHGRAVEAVPVLFAGLLDHHGTKGPAEVTAKRRYLLFDTVRKARALGVPFAPPRHHPFKPLLALRVASVPMDAGAQRKLIDRIYAGIWSGESADAEDEATIARFAGEAGLDARGLLEGAQSSEGKARLKDQTARAIADGVFGVPTVLADGEMFWGVDALPELDRFLAGGAPTLDGDAIARWSTVTPSAERPGAKR
jgi:2-hydroxychromene-2-carboxylate isomerase